MKRTAIGISAISIVLLAPAVATAQNAPSLRLFAETGFGGDARRLDRGVENLGTMTFNDKAQSMIAEGRWEVCLDARYAGGCRVVQGRVSDMGDWNARVSSVRYLGPSDWGTSGEMGAGTQVAAAGSAVPGPATARTQAPGQGQAGAQASARPHYPYPVDFQPDMIGKIFETSYGRLTLERWDRAGVAGPYTGVAENGADAGRLEGVLTSDPGSNGATFQGHWFSKTSAVACSTERGGTYHWGSATLMFGSDRNDFQGFWDHCDDGGAADGPWHGEMVGRDAVITAAVNAQLASGQTGVASRAPGSGSTASASAAPARPGQAQPVPVDSQGRPLPGFVDRTARAAGEEAERRVQDRVREGIGRIF